MNDYASVCSGSEGAGVGAVKAGFRPLFGIEIDPAIAQVAERNGFPLIVADMTTVDYTSLPTPEWFHMSPVCTRASLANKQRGESLLDLAIADACCRAIATLRPPWISLENVWPYRHFESFRRIQKTMADEGYAVDYWHVNSADYGVAQTRKRLILCASRIALPTPPPTSHYDNKSGHMSLFDEPWTSWYDTISDLIPTLPIKRGSMPAWQQKLKPAWLDSYHGAYVIDDTKGGNATRLTIRKQHQPFWTVVTRPAAKITLFHQGLRRGLNARCLARFNGLEDSYWLPDSPELAAKVLGNMHLPIVQQRLMEANIRR